MVAGTANLILGIAGSVIGRPGLEPESLIAHARQRLGGFKVPKEIYVVDEFPTNPSGKVLKRTVEWTLAEAGTAR